MTFFFFFLKSKILISLLSQLDEAQTTLKGNWKQHRGVWLCPDVNNLQKGMSSICLANSYTMNWIVMAAHIVGWEIIIFFSSSRSLQFKNDYYSSEQILNLGSCSMSTLRLWALLQPWDWLNLNGHYHCFLQKVW